AAYYQVIEAEAEVVRRVYQRYTVEHLSIGAIARLLNEQGVPTRKRVSRWCRSMVWAILRNPAYKGTACFGKTEIRPRQRVTRPLRMRGGVADRNSANHERPRKEWIEISRSRDRQWRDLFPCAGTIDVQQDPCATSHDSTQHLSRDGIVQQVRLCALQNIGTYKRAEDLLLSLPRFGWMEVSQRCSLQ